VEFRATFRTIPSGRGMARNLKSPDQLRCV